MNDVAQIIAAYGAAWTETDFDKRLALIENVLAETGRYTDPTADITGPAALCAHIGRFHESRPGARIEVTSAADAHHDVLHFTWRLVDADGATGIRGHDFCVMDENGRLARIVGFFGEPGPL